MFVGKQREDATTRQAIVFIEGMLTITSPLHKAEVGCRQHRTVRICQYLIDSRTCVLEGQDLHLIVLISTQTPFNQAYPETALRIGCHRNDVQSEVRNLLDESTFSKTNQFGRASRGSTNYRCPNIVV